MKKNLILCVDPSDSAAYSTISAALEAAAGSLSLSETDEHNIIIEIAPGTYHERLEIHTPYLTMRGTGSSASDVIITHGDYARAIHADGEEYGTFRTATLYIDAPHVTLQNLTIENSAGPGHAVGQALALYVDSDCVFFDNCRMLGHQDTVFTGPIPNDDVVADGPIKAEQRHFFKDCFIAGDVDFIFGTSAAYFENCEIFSYFRNGKICGYTTAPSTPKGQKYGYIFNKCRFTSDCPPDSVFLSRPWRDYAKVVIANSYLGEHIRRDGWHDWQRPVTHTTTFYAECNNYGPGSDTSQRASFSYVLPSDKASEYDFSALSGSPKLIFEKLI